MCFDGLTIKHGNFSLPGCVIWKMMTNSMLNIPESNVSQKSDPPWIKWQCCWEKCDLIYLLPRMRSKGSRFTLGFFLGEILNYN